MNEGGSKARRLRCAVLRGFLSAAAALALASGLSGCPPFIQPLHGPDAEALKERPAEAATRALAADDFGTTEQILAEAISARPDPPAAPDPETAELFAIAARLRIRQPIDIDTFSY